MKRLVRMAIGALALANAAVGDAAERSPCVPPAEARAMISVLLPDVAAALSDRCAASLAPAATLRAGLPPLVARWRDEADAQRPLAHRALARITGRGDVSADADTVLRAMGKTKAGLVRSISPATCTFADEALTLLAPLPSTNLSGLVLLILRQIGGYGGDGARNDSICPDDRP